MVWWFTLDNLVFHPADGRRAGPAAMRRRHTLPQIVIFIQRTRARGQQSPTGRLTRCSAQQTVSFPLPMRYQ
jgi:hypothetical protein